MKKLDRIDFFIIVIVIFLLGVMAMPRYVKDQIANDKKMCLTNMRKIAFAKQKWAADNKAEKGASCTMEELVPEYLPEKLKCPSGAKPYIVNPIDKNPVCPNQHTLPVHNKPF